MISRTFLWAIILALVILIALTTTAEARKKNRKRDGPGTPPEVSGRKKDKSKKDTSPTADGPDSLPVPVSEGDPTTTIAMKDVPMADPAAAPDVESQTTKRQGKHRKRDGKRRNNEETETSEDVVVKGRKEKNHKKDKSERKKHHKKHNREGTTTMMMVEDGADNAQPDVNAENDPVAATVGPVDTDPLVEPAVDLDVDIEMTMSMTTGMMSEKREKKHHRNREGKRISDQGETNVEERREKGHRKKNKNEKKKQRKNDPETAAEETEMTVNPTPSPAADGVKLTPSGPSPVQTTQQQSTQAKSDMSKKEIRKEKRQKKKNKHEREMADEAQVELSKTERRIQRLERKMERMGHTRKNATKIPCEDHNDCQHGQCCLLRRGKRVCHVVNKSEGHHCVHGCMCSEGLTCVSRNNKSLSKGHCRRVDITETTGEGAAVENPDTGAVANELPQ